MDEIIRSDFVRSSLPLPRNVEYSEKNYLELRNFVLSEAIRFPPNVYAGTDSTHSLKGKRLPDSTFMDFFR